MRTILARAVLLGAQKIRPCIETVGSQLKLFDNLKSMTTGTLSERSPPPVADQKH